MGDDDGRYAGLIVFSASLFSLATGLFFSVVVTRRLSVEEYGILQFYFAAVAYLVLPGTLANFWLTRDLGRAKDVLNTGVIMSGLLSVATSSLLIVIASWSGPTVKLTLEVLLSFLLYLLMLYLSNSLDSASIGVAQSLQGVGIFLQETVKLLVGVILVAQLRMGLLGVVLSIDAGLLLKCLVMYLKMPSRARGRINVSTGLLWLRRWWVPALVILPSLLSSIDLIILTYVTSSTILTAYLGLSRTLAAILTYPNLLAISLYPRLLGGGGGEEIEKAMKWVMMFALPMTAGMIILALPIVGLFGPGYESAAVALQVLSFVAFFNVVKGLSLAILQGRERVDVKENASLSDLMRSNLAVPRLIELVAQVLYVVAAMIVGWLLWAQGSPPGVVVVALAAVNLVITIPMSLVVWQLSTRTCKFNVPWKHLMKYLLATVVMAAVLQTFFHIGTTDVRVFELAFDLLVAVLTGAAVYFAVLFVIDRKLASEMYQLIVPWMIRGADAHRTSISTQQNADPESN